ncbi:cold-shock protein [Rhizobium sp. No.120]
MAAGTLKWLDAGRGFGFIQPDDASTDVFVHISALERDGISALKDGQKVSYDLIQDHKTGKSSADNVQAI